MKATAVTVDEFDNPRDHGFSVGVNINISGVSGSTGASSEASMQDFITDLSQSHPHLTPLLLDEASEPSGNAVGSNIS